MSSYDFNDQTSRMSFVNKMRAQGVPDKDIADFIVKKQKQQTVFEGSAGSDIETLAFNVQQGYMTPAAAIQKNPDVGITLASLGYKAPESTTSKPEFYRKMANAKSASEEALKMLQTGNVSTGPIATRMQKFGEMFGQTGTGTDYRAALGLAGSQLFNALAGTTQSEVELKRLETLIPKDTDQEAVAERKLKMLISLLDKQLVAEGFSTGSEDGLDVNFFSDKGKPAPISPENIVVEPNEKNISGEFSKPGDLTRTEDGRLKISGDYEDFSKKIENQKPAIIDNGLVRFLANSEFLPIAGGIAGGILGSGVGSIATGAAGAMGGEALKQGLSELLDPDKQDKGDMAKAIFFEGIIDATLSGFTLGIGGIANKLILKKAGVESLEQVLDAGAKDLIEGATKETAEGVVKTGDGKVALALKDRGINMLKKKFPMTPTQEIKFKNAHGIGFYEYMWDNNIPMSAGEAVMNGKKLMKLGKENLESIFTGKSIETKKVVDLLKKRRSEYVRISEKSGEEIVNPAAKNGIDQLDSYIEWVESFGDTIPASEYNTVKQGLQEAFPKGVGASDMDMKVLQSAARDVKIDIEKLPIDIKEQLAIKGNNFKIAYGKNLQIVGDKAMTKNGSKALLDWTDGLLLSNPKALAIKKVKDLLDGIAPDLQLKFIKNSYDIAVNKQKELIKSGVPKEQIDTALRSVLRKILVLSDKLNVNFGIDKGLQDVGMRAIRETGEAGLKQIPQMGQEQQEVSGLGLPMGNQPINQDIGINLSAFSPEGGVLYK